MKNITTATTATTNFEITTPWGLCLTGDPDAPEGAGDAILAGQMAGQDEHGAAWRAVPCSQCGEAAVASPHWWEGGHFCARHMSSAVAQAIADMEE